MSQAAPLKRRSFFQWLAEHLYYCGNQAKRSTVLRPPFCFLRVCVKRESRPAVLFSILSPPASLSTCPPSPPCINPSRHWRPFIFLSLLHPSVLPTFVHFTTHLSSACLALVPLLSFAAVWSYNSAVFFSCPVVSSSHFFFSLFPLSFLLSCYFSFCTFVCKKVLRSFTQRSTV